MVNITNQNSYQLAINFIKQETDGPIVNEREHRIFYKGQFMKPKVHIGIMLEHSRVLP